MRVSTVRALIVLSVPWAGVAGCWGDTTGGDLPVGDETSSGGTGTAASGTGGITASGGSGGHAGSFSTTGGGGGGSGGTGVGGAEAPDACEDGARNHGETDVDCGGVSDCSRCGVGQRCNADSDCLSEYCANNVCQDSNCGDGVQNRSETDVDCGGNCAPHRVCEIGMSCVVDRDCETSVCVDDICVEHCESRTRDMDETDVDCGGSICSPCGSGQRCELSEDCQSLVCEGNECAAPRCDDGIANGDETDVDCGGACAFECLMGDYCMHASDCRSETCTDGKCVADLEIVAGDVIDDFEDANLAILNDAGRSGTWVRFGDGYGEDALTVTSISGQRRSSQYALHHSGSGFDNWGSGLLVDLDNSGGQVASKQPYDLSGFSGITFWARAETPIMLTVTLPDANTDSAGNRCTTCDHHWYARVTIDSEWRRYTVELNELVLEAGSVPAPESFDVSNVFSVQFKVAAGIEFDFMLDDVALIR